MLSVIILSLPIMIQQQSAIISTGTDSDSGTDVCTDDCRVCVCGHYYSFAQQLVFETYP
jgi:hypothetical protein